jgi:hypothetical protein
MSLSLSARVRLMFPMPKMTTKKMIKNRVFI